MNGTTTALIVGTGRSGTALLRSILRAHPAIFGIQNEVSYLFPLFQRYGTTIDNLAAAVELISSHPKFPHQAIDRRALEREFSADVAPLPLRDFLRRVFALAMQERRGRGAGSESVLLLKHPRAIFHLPDFARSFPGLKVIQIVRDPRAVVHSYLKRWPSPVSQVSRHWCNALAAGDAWRQSHPGGYLRLRHEDLVADTRREVERLCRFLALPFDEQVLRFEQPACYKGDLKRVGGVADPAPRGHADSATNVKWRAHLEAEQIKVIERRCRRWMAAFDYPLSNPPVSKARWLGLVAAEWCWRTRNSGIRICRRGQRLAQLVQQRVLNLKDHARRGLG